jgi:hypothetical protein
MARCMSRCRRFAVLFLPAVALSALAARAQAPRHTENVVLIVSDGLRWQEIFRGADSTLVNHRWGGVDDTIALRRAFVRDEPAAARRALLPFLWDSVGRNGQIFGNVSAGSVATVTNGLKFSYPGYSEMITGHADPRIHSNDAPPNPNLTVFEWLGREPRYRGKVAVFGTWDAFPRIFNRERSGLPIYAGWETPFPTRPDAAEATINRLYATTTRLWGDELAYDSFMQAAVLDYVEHEHPRVLFVGYGETDEWAHSRRYDQTLESAHRVDSFIAELWNSMQRIPQYRGRTTFIITADHGRGGTPNDWTDHGEKVAGAENIWIAVLGPDTPSLGERTGTGPVTQSQIAATLAAALGLDYRSAEPAAAPPITSAISGRGAEPATPR